MKRTRAAIGFVAVLFITMAVLWVAKRALAPARLASLTPVRVVTSQNLWCGLTLLADDLGYFRSEGIDASLSYQAAGRLNMEALASGHADVGNIVEVNLANFGLAGAKGLQVVARIVAARDFSIVARKSSGIRSRRDLMGKTLAFASGTGAEMYARSLQEQQGWSDTQIIFRKVQPAALQSSILSGAVQAVAAWEPFAHNIKTALGEDAFVLRDPAVYEGVMNLAVRKAWADSNPATIVSIIRALKQAETFVQGHPDSARRILARRTSIDSATVSAIWSFFSYRVDLDTTEQARLTKRVAEALVRADTSIHRTVPDYQTYFEPRYMALALKSRDR